MIEELGITDSEFQQNTDSYFTMAGLGSEGLNRLFMNIHLLTTLCFVAISIARWIVKLDMEGDSCPSQYILPFAIYFRGPGF